MRFALCAALLLIGLPASLPALAQENMEGVVKVTNTETSYPFWSPDGRRIVFHSNRLDNNWDIYVMDADGTHLVRLTNTKGDEMTPVWSPDGSMIAFTTDRDGNNEIYVMNADGSHQHNVTNDPGDDMHPKWAPDSKSISFSSVRGYWNVVDHWAVDADGTNERRITRSVTIDTYCEWSPDYTKLVGRRIIDAGNSEVFLFDADGSNPVNLTNSDAYDGWPSWAPDMKSIYFASERTGAAQVYRMALDGSHLERVIDQPGDWAKPIVSHDGTQMLCTRTLDGNVDVYILDLTRPVSDQALTKVSNIQNVDPDLSPDGERIVFASNRTGNWQIYTVDTQGENLVRLTDNKSEDQAPRWSPDGSQIAFVSDRDGNREIYMMNADGSGQTNLSHDAADDSRPAWSADGRRIMYASDRGSTEGPAVFSVNVDGSESRQASGVSGVLSPDESVLASIRQDGQGTMRLVVSRPDGSGERVLGGDLQAVGQPAWSGDGTRIAFVADSAGHREPYVINADGSGLRKVVAVPGNYRAAAPRFAPDSDRIVFTLEREGTVDIYMK